MRKPLTAEQITNLTKHVANAIDTKWDFINNEYHSEKAFEIFQDLFYLLDFEKKYRTKSGQIQQNPSGCDSVICSVFFSVEVGKAPASFSVEVERERENEGILLCFGELAKHYKINK